MPHITTQRGLKWFCDVKGKGECLFFLHGWGANRKIWRQQTEYFAKDFSVLSVDLPGHGSSPWKEMSFTDIAHDLESVLFSLGFKEANIIGSSLGGFVALKLIEHFPHLAKRLILIGTLPRFTKSPSYPFGLDKTQIKQLEDQLGVDYPIILNVFFRSLFTLKERRSCRILWLQQFRHPEDVPDPAALKTYLHILEKEDLRETMRKLSIPVLFVNGADDYICSKEAAKAFSSEVSGSRLHVFGGCGHFPFLTQPKEFNSLVQGFLKDDKNSA